HLHTWLAEVRPSPQEWREAIGFLTRAGQMSVGGRQEFVLLSDVLGASILVDQLSDHGTAGATESTVLGPFYIEGAPVMCPGADIAGTGLGEPLYVEVEVRAASGEPLAGATVEAWQADAEGLYDVQRADCDSPRLRARFSSDPAGRVRFWSI